jgi:hypothetical protein
VHCAPAVSLTNRFMFMILLLLCNLHTCCTLGHLLPLSATTGLQEHVLCMLPVAVQLPTCMPLRRNADCTWVHWIWDGRGVWVRVGDRGRALQRASVAQCVHVIAVRACKSSAHEFDCCQGCSVQLLAVCLQLAASSGCYLCALVRAPPDVPTRQELLFVRLGEYCY